MSRNWNGKINEEAKKEYDDRVNAINDENRVKIAHALDAFYDQMSDGNSHKISFLVVANEFNLQNIKLGGLSPASFVQRIETDIDKSAEFTGIDQKTAELFKDELVKYFSSLDSLEQNQLEELVKYKTEKQKLYEDAETVAIEDSFRKFAINSSSFSIMPLTTAYSKLPSDRVTAILDSFLNNKEKEYLLPKSLSKEELTTKAQEFTERLELYKNEKERIKNEKKQKRNAEQKESETKEETAEQKPNTTEPRNSVSPIRGGEENVKTLVPSNSEEKTRG